MLFARRAFASIGYGSWCNNLLHWTNAIIITRVIMQYLPNIPPITSCKRDQKKTQKNFFSMLQRHYFSRIVCMCVSKLVFKENSNLLQAGVMSSLPICAIFAMLNNAYVYFCLLSTNVFLHIFQMYFVENEEDLRLVVVSAVPLLPGAVQTKFSVKIFFKIFQTIWGGSLLT